MPEPTPGALRALALACALLAALGAAEGEPHVTYTNPVVEPVAADPSVIRAPDGDYYLYATQDAWDGREHYLPMFRSRDLIDWEYLGDAFAWPPSWKRGGGFYWAPEVVRAGDEYRLYYAASLWGDPDPCIGMATAAHPAGPWRDLERPVFCSEDIGVGNSIDPFVWMADEAPVMIWGSFHGIHAVRLTADGRDPDGEPVLLADTRFEAPYVVERDGRYVLFLSAGSCCAGADSTYRLYVGRSDDLLGPYVDADGRDLRDGGGTLLLDATDAWLGPGHNAVARDDAGEDWLVYHAIPRGNPRLSNTATRRPALIDPITWEDGWPRVDGPSDAPRPAPAVAPR